MTRTAVKSVTKYTERSKEAHGHYVYGSRQSHGYRVVRGRGPAVEPVSDGGHSDEDVGEDGLEVYGVWWKGAEGDMEYGGPGKRTSRKRERKVDKGRSDAGWCGPGARWRDLGRWQGFRGQRCATKN